jgi:carbon storage regulator CsrA
MLVLTRKIGESIRIGDHITIEVRRVAGNRVTIAVDAPRDVRILRGELARLLEPICSTPPPNHTSEASQTKNTTPSSTPAGAAD